MERTICKRCGKEVHVKGFPPGSKEAQPFCHNCDEYVPTETKEVPEPDPEKLHLSLRIDVAYDLNGMIKEDMKENLRFLAAYTIDKGMLTQDTSATVDEWTAHVHERRNVKADAELSDHDRAEVERCRRELAEEAYEKLKAKVEKSPLRRVTDGENDFVMDGADGVWIGIDNISVWVRRTKDGVDVQLSPTKCENHTQMDTCSALFAHAAEYKCPVCGEFNEFSARPLCMNQPSYDDNGRLNRNPTYDEEGRCPTCREKAEEKEEGDDDRPG